MKLNQTLNYRLAIVSRTTAAIIGGYGVAASATAFLSVLLPWARADAVITATLLSFIVYTCAVLWVFAARNAWQAWIGIVVPCVVMLLGVLLWRGTI